MQTSGASRREIAKPRLDVIASAAKQSILSFCCGHGLLRFARNDGSTIGSLKIESVAKYERATPSAVILRESGVSSTPRLLGSISGASEYWIARLRGRRRLRVWQSHHCPTRTTARSQKIRWS